jgi:hypothetical protein
MVSAASPAAYTGVNPRLNVAMNEIKRKSRDRFINDPIGYINTDA